MVYYKSNIRQEVIHSASGVLAVKLLSGKAPLAACGALAMV